MKMYQRYAAFVDKLIFENPDLVDQGLRSRLEIRAGYGLSFRFPKTVIEFIEEWRHVYHWAVKKAILDYRFLVANEEERSYFLGLQIFPGKEQAVIPPRYVFGS